MSRHISRRGILRSICLVTAAAAALVTLRPTTARAAEKLGNSLDWIPADASFFSTSMRLKEQVTLVANSKAWAKLRAIPTVQLGWQMAEAQLRAPGGPLDALAKNKDLVDLGGEMLSSEILIYGDQSVVGFVDLLGQLNNAMTYSSFSAFYNIRRPGAEEQSARMLLNNLAGNAGLLQAPNIVVGFKIADEKRALAQIKRLEAVAGALLQQTPIPAGSLKQAKIGKYDFLTLSLDGQLVPWDELPVALLEEVPGQYDQLIEKLKTLTLAISIGVREGYLLVSIGSSNDHLASLGQGQRLVDLPEFKPLAAYAKQRLTGVSYVSKQLNTHLTTSKQDIDNLSEMVRELLAEVKLDAQLQQRILADAERLAKDLKAYVPDAGATMEFSFLTPRGYESYSYDWSQNLDLDGSQRLTLLDHVGGSPLMAFVGRTKYTPEQYDLMVKWLQVGHQYFEELAIPQMPEKDRQQYKEVFEKVRPLLARLNNATRTMLLPALKDSQLGLVLDAKIKSAQWVAALPQNGVELPMLEPALVVGVSDAELLKKAGAEYEAVIRDALKLLPGDLLSKLLPDGEFKFESKQLKNGTMCWRALPKELGLDSQILPNAALGKDVLVLTIGPAHSDRLLAVTPLAASGVLSDSKRPLATAGVCNWPAFVDAVTPWVDFGVRTYFAETTKQRPQDAAGKDSFEVKSTLDQVHVGLEVLKALQTITSATYPEGAAMVTHSEVYIKDVE